MGAGFSCSCGSSNTRWCRAAAGAAADMQVAQQQLTPDPTPKHGSGSQMLTEVPLAQGLHNGHQAVALLRGDHRCPPPGREHQCLAEMGPALGGWVVGAAHTSWGGWEHLKGSIIGSSKAGACPTHPPTPTHPTTHPHPCSPLSRAAAPTPHNQQGDLVLAHSPAALPLHLQTAPHQPLQGCSKDIWYLPSLTPSPAAAPLNPHRTSHSTPEGLHHQRGHLVLAHVCKAGAEVDAATGHKVRHLHPPAAGHAAVHGQASLWVDGWRLWNTCHLSRPRLRCSMPACHGRGPAASTRQQRQHCPHQELQELPEKEQQPAAAASPTCSKGTL